MLGYIVGGLVLILVLCVWGDYADRREDARLSPEQLAEKRKKQASERKLANQRNAELTATLSHGTKNTAMICPHCETKGEVRTKQVQKKKGISGGKAAGAILTGGVSMLATGLSRKEGMTQAYCGQCKNSWSF